MRLHIGYKVALEACEQIYINNVTEIS